MKTIVAFLPLPRRMVGATTCGLRAVHAVVSALAATLLVLLAARIQTPRSLLNIVEQSADCAQ
jgi:hypothetical protein